MSEYPADWELIARRVKAKAGWRCVRCGHPDRANQCDALCRHIASPRQRMLTVHHLDGVKSNCADWNLAALCQICHLFIQSAYNPSQLTLAGCLYEEWLKPYEAGRKRVARKALSKGSDHASRIESAS